MSVEYTVCAGIGIPFDIETLERFGAYELADELRNTDDEFELLDKLTDRKFVTYETGGNAVLGDITNYLFAEDPVNFVDEFVFTLRDLGLRLLQKSDLRFISELYIG